MTIGDRHWVQPYRHYNSYGPLGIEQNFDSNYNVIADPNVVLANSAGANTIETVSQMVFTRLDVYAEEIPGRPDLVLGGIVQHSPMSQSFDLVSPAPPDGLVAMTGADAIGKRFGRIVQNFVDDATGTFFLCLVDDMFDKGPMLVLADYLVTR